MVDILYTQRGWHLAAARTLGAINRVPTVPTVPAGAGAAHALQRDLIRAHGA